MGRPWPGALRRRRFAGPAADRRACYRVRAAGTGPGGLPREGRHPIRSGPQRHRSHAQRVHGTAGRERDSGAVRIPPGRRFRPAGSRSARLSEPDRDRARIRAVLPSGRDFRGHRQQAAANEPGNSFASKHDSPRQRRYRRAAAARSAGRPRQPTGRHRRPASGRQTGALGGHRWTAPGRQRLRHDQGLPVLHLYRDSA